MNCVVICIALLVGAGSIQCATIPLLEVRQSANHIEAPATAAAAPRVAVAEAAPMLLCAGLCNARAPPPGAVSRGPVCAYNAVGTARTFANLCDLEAASCRDSTFYAIASIGEC